MSTFENGTNETKHHLVSAEELSSLRDKLREAQETLEAIRSGEVDAVVVTGDAGAQIYTLTSAEEPYRVFVEQMQEGAVTVSQDGTILYCNRKFAEFLGSDLERVIGSDAPAHFGKAVWLALAQGVKTGSAVKSEADLRRPTGKPLPVMITASRLPLGEDTVICLVVTDLSEQREKFELAAAKEIAEAANHSKDAFLAALSHELRTPLTPALMGACLLEREKDLSPKGTELVTMIRRNVELEIRLIDDLLDLTRITQRKIKLRPKPIDLHTVIREAAAVCQTDIHERSQTLELALDAADSRLLGDSVRLQQVIWNLIRNASKFSSREQKILVRTHNDHEGRITVEVIDDGVGIEPDLIDRLFSPFEQGGEDTTRRYGGLGLGLVISKSITELHEGGTITAASPGKGQGAKFTVALQLLPAHHDGEGINSRGRILLVEDNPDTRMALSMLLESLDYHVQTGESVKTGSDLARTSTFDFVISDVGLPDGNGYDLMRELSTRYGLRGIAVSGFGMPEDISRSIDAGFDYHLTKPILAADLEAAIDKLRATTAAV